MTALILAVMTASAQDKIVNGVEANADEFPETVLVGGGGTCTGSLIHPEWVLTAAHCFGSVDFELQGPDGGTTISFGQGGPAGFTDVVEASNIVIHEKYVALEADLNAYSLINQTADDDVYYSLMTNDIALVKLSRPVNGALMSLNETPIDNDWLFADITVTHIGFGITSFEGSGTGTKRYTDVPIVGWSGEPPEGNWGVSFFDGEEGRATCQGDSGGPGVVREGDNAYYQIGITSYGIRCGGAIGTKMRVDPYIDWILGVQDGARDDGEITEGEYIRDEELRVPSIQLGAAGPPKFECSHQLNDDGDSFALAAVPFELRCSTTLSDPETLDKITWYWGDGSEEDVRTTNLERAEHDYTEMGVYNVRACFEGVRGDIPYDQCVLKTNHVNACDLPEVLFEVEPLDELRLGLRNRTSLRAHNCITNAQWDIYAGATATGEPIASLNGWEPVPKLEEPGEYTIVLNVGGLAGTAAASATVKLKRSGGGGCNAATVAPMFGLMALLPMLGLRRRR